ncbi:hypothetical protein D7Z54_26415 [Salibacterium salarium]|uniref:Lipoprotein n=1 Tax=Salibacterium salarium TaxID=284579 RepID=A0A428MWC3_9BACI|nr:hypothetical protein [Salibacterium salarium]RSL30376.1 hypothetical protein D7Z54_26415 [Salibacterium salarium]
MKGHVFILIVTFILAGCTSDDEQIEAESSLNDAEEELEKLQEENKELHHEAEEHREQNESLHEELQAYKDFINKDVIESLDNTQLQPLAKSQWDYKLVIDGKEMTETKTIETSSSEVEIRFVEEQPLHTVLPHEIHNEGQISSNLTEHIEISPAEYDRQAPAGGNINSIIYRFNNLQKETIHVTVTDELRNRLGMEKNEIKILMEE